MTTKSLIDKQNHLFATSDECRKAFAAVEAAADELKMVQGREADAKALADSAELIKRLVKECSTAAVDLQDKIDEAIDREYA